MQAPTPHRPSPPRLTTPTTDITNPAWAQQNLLPTDHRPPRAPSPRPPANATTSTNANASTSSASRIKKRKPWRKLLWVKQDYPDNWVDPTFLSQLQRNINVHPYDFYSLVADSTVIVQHLSSVVIFVTSFIAMFKERVSPVSVALASTALTVAGWAVWDMGWEKREKVVRGIREHRRRGINGNGSGGGGSGSGGERGNGGGGGGSSGASAPNSPVKKHRIDSMDAGDNANTSTATAADTETTTATTQESQDEQSYVRKEQRSRRLKTAKSTLLIYFTLLGLSPILRSLTGSITDDSIWAIATWLFLANTLSFDYGSGVEVKFPASLSTNAAITSSVVLASRLPSEGDLPPNTAHVFSLILISIQVFGLFPVFRRYLKHVSWGLHVCLTVVLVLGAAGGLGGVVGWGWAVVWVLGVVGGMGGCGWWLIGLQKYKNEIHGPWDPARPVIRRQWE
ncbi:GPI2-domain-containing protein [Choiromyces venosus 120613-1]|uniref:GPI2-domain-containing protein n=1 Tax=Choiromyces venosus 120613-1 TaxID=1336337 RepID=A0A3N4KA10_9PEZI|nr:GPI2-domain-containing protein [Choiromyces venosus 120613-1]